MDKRKEVKGEEGLGFEWIAGMSAEFNERMQQQTGLQPDEAAYWQLRILLSIAQQLSVLVSAVKDRG